MKEPSVDVQGGFAKISRKCSKLAKKWLRVKTLVNGFSWESVCSFEFNIFMFIFIDNLFCFSF